MREDHRVRRSPRDRLLCRLLPSISTLRTLECLKCYVTERREGNTFHSHGQYHGWINQGLDPFFRGCLGGSHCDLLGGYREERLL